jgi:hypothetical protein
MLPGNLEAEAESAIQIDGSPLGNADGGAHPDV